MVWTNNGTIFYPGERPSAVRPDLRISTQQLMQANSGMSFAHELYDPVAHRRNKNTASQIAVSLARRSGTPIMLTAGGDVRERADAPLDSRLVRALNGRHPRSKTQLDRWLKDMDSALRPDQRLALTMAYEATYGPLPNTNLGRDPEDALDEDDTGATLPDPPPARRPSLGALGLRRQTRLTAREFERRLHEHGVPVRYHAQLMVQDAAQRAGLAQRVTPHRLRASVATLLLDAGMPIDQVQNFLRHKHLSTTQLYAETSLKSLGEHYLRAFS
jgi:hypothetical protein